MKIFEANVTNNVLDFLRKKLNRTTTLITANQKMFDSCGIREFFSNELEFENIKKIICSVEDLVEESDRAEYGDFQTNLDLAINISDYLNQCGSNPKIVLEPTCGKGSFIIACLKTFRQIEKIIAVEIYKPYVWETKFNILEFFINNSEIRIPEITINHFNVFDFDFQEISKKYLQEEILIIGNPPWVTNSKLGSLESNNLPTKSNFKNHKGLDAMTGKGNFDIAEYITLMMFDSFQFITGHLAFLIKNSVVKNIMFDQMRRNYKISSFRILNIDSKKEFNVSVEASVFYCKLNDSSEFICKEYDFYNNTILKNSFGWVGNKFVSSIKLYSENSDIDGACQFEWRQGVKHDCSSIMEFERINDCFVNGLGQIVDIEEDMVYGLLKSSDLKKEVIDKTRKYTIITQKKVGQDTAFIENKYPKTYNYLNSNRAQFDLRKSIIYTNKPPFSIFGVGDYSFTPFKVVISGLYKNYYFNLILPQNEKPIMLDDTCYLIGFDRIEFAIYTFILLNWEKTKAFLKSITFIDSKRTFTKDILMRIDLLKISTQIPNFIINNEVDNLNKEYNLNINLDSWLDFIKILKPTLTHQLSLL